MEKIITYSEIRKYTYINDTILKKPIKGIIIGFRGGLNKNEMFNEDMPEGIEYGKEGILYVAPYNRPWAWMNKQAVSYTDEVMDVLIQHYNLPDDIPIVSSGSSMGGQSALIYSKCAKRTPVACVASCPVCDLVYHFYERADVPRSLYGAFYNEEGSLEEVLKKHSPLHLADKMPKINYHIFHCDKDTRVNIHSHSEKFVSAMKVLGHTITYDIVRGRDHGDLSEEAAELFKNYCIEEIEKRY